MTDFPLIKKIVIKTDAETIIINDKEMMIFLARCCSIFLELKMEN